MPDLIGTLTIVIPQPTSGGTTPTAEAALVIAPNPLTLRPGETQRVSVEVMRADGFLVSPPTGAVLLGFWAGDGRGIDARPVGNSQYEFTAPATLAPGQVEFTVVLRNWEG